MEPLFSYPTCLLELLWLQFVLLRFWDWMGICNMQSIYKYKRSRTWDQGQETTQRIIYQLRGSFRTKNKCCSRVPMIYTSKKSPKLRNLKSQTSTIELPSGILGTKRKQNLPSIARCNPLPWIFLLSPTQKPTILSRSKDYTSDLLFLQ